jgi:hypothetical protein
MILSELKPLNEKTNENPKVPASKIIVGIFKEIINVKLLKENVAFLFISLLNFFIFFVYFIPFIYIPVRARELKIPNYPLILSIIGNLIIFFYKMDKF